MSSMHNILNGTDAIDWYENHGVGTLSKRTDPTEEARDRITLDEAAAIAREDENLVALHVPVAEVRVVQVDWENNAHVWWDAFETAVTDGTAPDPVLQSVAQDFSDALDEIYLPTELAERFIAWCATLPGFVDGNERAPTALICQEPS